MIDFFSDPAVTRALVAALLVACSGAPLGVILVLRRMSLMGDVIAHAILPGTAAGFLVAGMSFAAMSLGGLIAGLIVALVAGLATRFTDLREDSSLVATYLIAVAIGILLLATHGSSQDLEDILFGSAESINRHMLLVMGLVTSVTMVTLAVIYRPLVVESFDPIFMRALHCRGGAYHIVFMLLVVLNMVEGYRTLGTLMASTLLIIPAIIAPFWTQRLTTQLVFAVLVGCMASLIGILMAAYAKVPSGPSITLVLGLIYFLSFVVGRFGSIRARYFPFRHLAH